MVKDKKITLNVSHLILGAIILLLLFFIFLKPKQYDFSQVDKNQRKVDSLSYVIKNLQNEQTVLNNSITYHQNKIDLLDSKIANTNQDITDIRKYLSICLYFVKIKLKQHTLFVINQINGQVIQTGVKTRID